MNKYLPIAAAWLPLLSLASPPVADQGVVAQLAVAKVERESGGRQKLKSARDAAPGDVLEYRVTYRNTTHARARGVIGTLSIPANRFTYVPDSASSGLLLEASMDGRTFEPAPLLRLVVGEDGKTKMEPIPPTEYRALRWQLGDLPARASVTVSARMRVREPETVVVTNVVR
jgi:uncharacterized repeat protein (TIGR01451 family)